MVEGQIIGKLVQEAQAGDGSAFRALYEHFVGRIFNFLFRMLGSREEAEDLTQQTFLIVLQRLGSLRDVGQIESWIYRIARNEVYQKFRRKSPGSLDDEELGVEIEAFREPRLFANPEKLLLNQELRNQIQSVLDALPDKPREVFVLAVIQGMSYNEVANIVGRSLLSVKTDIYRARLHVKKELRKYLTA